MAGQSTAVAHVAAFSVDSRLEAAGALQEMLVDLIDLALQGKQGHWNLCGPMFRSLHLQLDQMVEAARNYADQLAERCLALGMAADGRLSTLTRATHLSAFPEGRIDDRQVVTLVVERLHTISEVARRRLKKLGDADPVSQDLVNEVLEGLEKQLWMFESFRADREK